MKLLKVTCVALLNNWPLESHFFIHWLIYSKISYILGIDRYKKMLQKKQRWIVSAFNGMYSVLLVYQVHRSHRQGPYTLERERKYVNKQLLDEVESNSYQGKWIWRNKYCQAWLFQRVEEGGARDALLAFQWLYLMVSGNQPIGPESVELEIAFCGREFYRTCVKRMGIVMELRRHRRSFQCVLLRMGKGLYIRTKGWQKTVQHPIKYLYLKWYIFKLLSQSWE